MKYHFKCCRSHLFWLIVSHSNGTLALKILWRFLHWTWPYWGIRMYQQCLSIEYGVKISAFTLGTRSVLVSIRAFSRASVSVSAWILASIGISNSVSVQHYLGPEKMKEHSFWLIVSHNNQTKDSLKFPSLEDLWTWPNIGIRIRRHQQCFSDTAKDDQTGIVPHLHNLSNLSWWFSGCCRR